ncbi:hypothetical protein HYV70_04495 [Candidatus Uhrbacteria bacterium]|nr:hypothetical protein [Candidatus Uhrbacteria bacterium]
MKEISSQERKLPKEEIESARDRFMDFCGNALNGVLGNFDNVFDPAMQTSRQRSELNVRESWKSFFERVHVFMSSRYESNGSICHENLEKFLPYEHRDPLEEGVVAEVEKIYLEMTER